MHNYHVFIADIIRLKQVLWNLQTTIFTLDILVYVCKNRHVEMLKSFKMFVLFTGMVTVY